MPDVPHLFKNIKQCLFNNKCITLPEDIVKNYGLTSNTVYCKHLEDLAMHQDNLELKLTSKLKLEDFQKNCHFDKLKISKSINVFNRDVSASLNYC